MIENSKFIGIVTEVIDEHCFSFRSDNNVKCQIGQIVGLNIANDIYMLANIEKIDVDYFLTNSREYFTSMASDNKLVELTKGNRSPKFSQSIKANFIGVYEFSNEDNHFIESKFSVNSYTPSIFQEVVSFNFDCIETIYGIKLNTQDYFELGTFLYPNYFNAGSLPAVDIATETFNSHTLISGVTGSGKSRLTALIANQLASKGGDVTVIDPHDEYVSFADTKSTNVYFLSKNEQLHSNRNDIYKRTLTFSYDYLKPKILYKLLPQLSPQQENYIYEVFDKDVIKRDLTFINLMSSMIEDLKSEIKSKREKSEIIDNLFKEAYAYAEKWQKEYSDKYKIDIKIAYYKLIIIQALKDEYAANIGKVQVIEAVYKKIIGLFEEGVFPINETIKIPSWLDSGNKKNNIINLDYDTNENIRRYVNAIIQCFFYPQNQHRTLIVDEAHLLLNEKSDKLGTSTLLSRLLRESRKFNLSIIFVTQNEIDVPHEIKSQFQNKFRFREEDDESLKYFDNQTCMCTIYKGKLSFPMRVNNIEKKE